MGTNSAPHSKQSGTATHSPQGPSACPLHHPNQTLHRVLNSLTFCKVADLALTLAIAFGVPRLVTESWAGQAPIDESSTLAGPRPNHLLLRRRKAGYQVVVTALDDVQCLLTGWNRSLLRSRGHRPPRLGRHYEGPGYHSTADHLAQVERRYSMAAMAKLERYPDCIAAGVPADAAAVTPIPGCGHGSHGSDRQIQFFCQHCGGLHTSVTTRELPPFPELD